MRYWPLYRKPPRAAVRPGGDRQLGWSYRPLVLVALGVVVLSMGASGAALHAEVPAAEGPWPSPDRTAATATDWMKAIVPAVFAAAGAFFGSWLNRRSENKRWSRAQTFDLMKWAADHALQADSSRSYVGMTFLRTLNGSNLVVSADKAMISEVAETLTAQPLREAEQEAEEPDFEVEDD